jgi:hypothetical protein
VEIAKDWNVSQDIRLRDLNISFKKPQSSIEKYLSEYRGLYRGTNLFSKMPGQTPVDRIIEHLKNNR